MAFCKFSPSYQSKNQTLIDNVFITDFLPKAPDLCIKAYLLGLCKCNQADDNENTLEYFAKTLNVCEEDVISLFKYWEDEGLVQVLSTNPIEVRYLEINSSISSIKKFDVTKYADFNFQAQELLGKRMIMPNEYSEFYNLFEHYHMEQNAVITIIKYCVDLKGFNLSPKYPLTVATEWAKEGLLTIQQIESKIEELGLVDMVIGDLFKELSIKRKIQLEDKQLLRKWQYDFGFSIDVIKEVAKRLKLKKSKIEISNIDRLLTKYYEMKLMSVQEIENYENEEENYLSIAIAVNKELGIYYEDLTKEIDTYVVPWVNMGFDVQTLKLIADNCFKSSIKTLEGYNNIINKLFRLGIVNVNSYLQYVNDNLAVDEKIKQVLSELNLTRNVNNMDRNFYSTWTESWGFADDIILYAAGLSKDKSNAIQYLNKILSNWNTQGVKTLEMAQKSKVETSDNNSFIHNNYSKEQISSLITNLDEWEV